MKQFAPLTPKAALRFSVWVAFIIVCSGILSCFLVDSLLSRTLPAWLSISLSLFVAIAAALAAGTVVVAIRLIPTKRQYCIEVATLALFVLGLVAIIAFWSEINVYPALLISQVKWLSWIPDSVALPACVAVVIISMMALQVLPEIFWGVVCSSFSPTMITVDYLAYRRILSDPKSPAQRDIVELLAMSHDVPVARLATLRRFWQIRFQPRNQVDKSFVWLMEQHRLEVLWEQDEREQQRRANKEP
jgi:hypothetical protein